MPNPVASGLPNPTDYDTSQPDVVFDRVTRLTWQRATNAALTWQEAALACEGLTLGGFDDWRLPGRLELISLVDFTRGSTLAYDAPPAIDEIFADRPKYGVVLWVGAKVNWFGPIAHWIVAFNQGETAWAYVDTENRFRCVRGETFAPHFELDATFPQDVVVDSALGLMWQRVATKEVHTRDDTDAYCQGLELAGFDDWRAPSMKEGQMLIDDSLPRPVIDTTLFLTETGFPGDLATSTAGLVPAGKWWNIDMEQGITLLNTYLASARCLRDL
jgi:hypothetical protein